MTTEEPKNIIKFPPRKPRALTKTYSAEAPYVVERQDWDDGQISYEVMDSRPDSYRIVCIASDDFGGNPYAKHDAEQIAKGLNLLLRMGKETLPSVNDNESL